jgi:mycothiol system anti-sigma-R factor
MDCAKTRFFLNAFLDGELDAQDRRDVACHLSRCPRCAARLESFRRLRALVKDCSPRASAPVDLRRRIAERRSRSRAWRRFWRPAVGAAALSLLVIPVVADSLTRPPSPAPMLSESPVEKSVRGHLFCLRCALKAKLGPAAATAAADPSAPHLAAFRAEDGEIWIVLNRDACPEALPKAEVDVRGRYFDSSHLLAAEEIRPISP